MPPSTGSTPCRQCGADLRSPDAECLQCLLNLGFLAEESNPPSSPTEDTRSSAGRVFADHELLDEIDRGGMGIVYRARQRSLDRIVALKLIREGQLGTREIVHRFRAEAAAAAALQHPNIVAIHEIGVHEGTHFFTMDYVEGQNLTQRVGQRPLPAKKAARYGKEVAEAIHYAHEQGILHRDLKPSNVLIDSATDQPRVTDFGLAKRLDGTASLTQTGQLLGSPHFMAPEQASHQRGKIGRPCDVYGIGGILYFLLIARPPFQGDSLEATLHRVLHEEVVPPRLLNPDVPCDLETICLKCLDKEPGRRYPTAQAVGEELGRFLRGEPIQARPATRLERTWRWCLRRPAFAGLLATATALVLTLSIGAPIVALRIQSARHIAEAHLYGADINRVHHALADQDLVHARGLLDRHRPHHGQRDQRGFEWRYLWRLCQGDQSVYLEPPVLVPSSVGFSHDGRFVAAAGKQDLSVIWNLGSKQVEQRLPPGNRFVAFDRKRPLLITAGKAGLKRWDTRTWEDHYLGATAEGANAVFSPDNRWLVVYGIGIQVWRTENWELVNENNFGGINYWVRSSLSVSRDSTLVACAADVPGFTTCEIGIFRLPSLERVSWNQLPKDSGALAFSPNHDLLAAGGWSGDVRLWDTRSGQEIPSNMKTSSRIMALAFNPDRPELVAAAGGNRGIQFWNVFTQKEDKRLHGATDQLMALAFSPDGQTIATGSNLQPITLWDATQNKGDIFSVPTEHRNYILGYTEDGERLVTIDATGRVMFRDARSLDVIETVVQLDLDSASVGDATFTVAAIATSPNMGKLALGMEDGTVQIWDLETRSSLSFETHSQTVRGVAFSPDGRQLVTAARDETRSENGKLRLWDLSTQSLMSQTSLDHISESVWAVCLRFAPKNGEIIAVGSGNALSIFRGQDLQRLSTYGDLGAFLAMRFSPDGRYLASGHGPGRTGYLAIWDTKDWSPNFLTGLALVPSDIAFSPDGSRMVSGGDRLIVWDTDTWQELARYKPPFHDNSFIRFSPDGNDLVVSDAEALRVWRAPSFEEIADREARLGRWP